MSAYDMGHAVDWMRARMSARTPGARGLAHDLAAQYQDAHKVPEGEWPDLYKDALLAIRLGAPRREVML